MTEKCVVCGLRWHVCKDKVIPPGGYVCPKCEYSGRARPARETQRKSREENENDGKRDFACFRSCGHFWLYPGRPGFVWAWDLWDKYQERRKRLQKTYPEPRRKDVEDYWKGAA